MEHLGLKSYFGVTGTDISQPALDKAKRGLYGPRKLVTTDERHKERVFSSGTREQPV